MTAFIKDEVFAPLAKRLASINVEHTYRQAIEVAVDEGREMLRHELRAEGAPREIADHVRGLGVRGLTGATGIPDRDPASDDALEWEFGAMDGSTPPHRTFSFVADDMADMAAGEAATRFSKQIADAS